jgi:predicted GIY-YIG superfamily endonuclease
MRKYKPRLSDALATGNRVVEEELGRLDVNWHEPAVYALRLCQPQSQDRFHQDWFETYDTEPPDELYNALQARSVYYVGAAKDLLDRLHEHLDNPNRSGAIMAAFPIHSVAQVWPQDSAELAFERESAKALAFKGPDRFVWQR